MIDLTQGPASLKTGNVNELIDLLARELPEHTVLTNKSETQPKIHIQQGLWRGLELKLEHSSEGLQLLGYKYRIPSIIAKIIVFLGSVITFSVISTIAVSIAVGQFYLMVGPIGGLAGLFMYSIVDDIIVARMRKSWSTETEEAISAVIT